MISIICCYNSEELFKEVLMNSIRTQDLLSEIIGVDNTKNSFTSAAEALNFGAEMANGDTLVFVHQDVIFEDHNILTSIHNYLEKFPRSIVGVAGAKQDGGVFTNITHGANRVSAGKNQITKETVVATLDECLIAIKKNVFMKYRFDSKTCDNWHLYGVDLCLTANKDNNSIIVLPLKIHHLSKGFLSNQYYDSLWKLIEKHRSNYQIISTTCTYIKTSFFGIFTFKIKLKGRKIFRYFKRIFR